MGGGASKCWCAKKRHRRRVQALTARIAALEEEVERAHRARESDMAAYEKHAGVMRQREEEWRKERRRLRAVAVSAGGGAAEVAVAEQLKEEQARREEAVERWKQLYLAIKAELDDLIHRTHQGGRWCGWGADQQAVIDGLQRELKARDDAADQLKLKLAAMEKEAARRDREIDILRQSLRILSCSRRSRGGIKKIKLHNASVN